ncbi:phycocyanobilin lyase [Fischerella thermalis CCMEE 5273]|uniref:PBS lyase HEAT domain protein repeat-containing protein n=1 Tax=Fischerella thermalis JSC-11 TaxID=741277 RepID=G6FPL2_9CYAN|nr:HEAT repeat domain-containing protein [Fischerella thermalis]PMB04219.1 phycocyanobilin lyase [Fischerella thermalis CCMEE 5273]PMB09667.1 phycocyanobilin lyase [Fischerella thermalis CCMEE 5328]EHC18812.1 PBS lyase HEAT domain protein repeat-containing protein [Fischerella thermalis JSC-11]MBF1989321.1 HEAT repeat domain-containing protein [Fischerella thermalis M58_A2018_009]MBF2060551.1 HEAT repeat domain-containing protein [Fischerella thermalis M66_A2018_004]
MIEPSAEAYSAENAPPLTKEQAIANLQSPDLSLRYYAAWWLGKNRVRDQAVVDALIVALEDEADRTEMGGYPLRRNAARALGKLGDMRAVPSLIKSLECSDFYVREAAAQSLATLKDIVAAPALMQLLNGGVAAAVPVPGRPHLTQPYEAVLEALGAIGATEAISLIEPFLDHPVPRVQCAAARAMYQLTQDAKYGQRLVQVLDSNDLKLRRVALGDLGAIGYLPAADAIANAKVENSFKLIALKGLLEHQLQQELDVSSLSEDAIRVMNLMDSLL